MQLPDLPLGLKRLLVRSCPNLEILPDLPPGLVDLVIGECEQIISLPPDLPESLQELSVDRSPIQQVTLALHPSADDRDYLLQWYATNECTIGLWGGHPQCTCWWAEMFLASTV